MSIIDNPRKVGIITMEQAAQLVNLAYDKYGSLFSPVKDADDNWVISRIEIESNVNEEVKWVNDLVLVDYNPKPDVHWW